MLTGAVRLCVIRGVLAVAALAFALSAAGAQVLAGDGGAVYSQAADGATSQAGSGVPNPFDPAPPVNLPTLDGPLVLEPGRGTGESFVFIGRSRLSARSQELWQASVEQLIASSPPDVHYVFMSYGTPTEVQADIEAIRQRVETAIQALPEEAQQHWRGHFHFVTANPLDQGDPFARLLVDWGTVLADVTARWEDETGSPQEVTTRGTTDRGWALSLVDTGPITGTLAWYGGLACGDTPPTDDVTGKIALIERGQCPFTEKVANAEKYGALAALIFTDPDRPITAMAGQCDPCPKIPVAMIERQVGLDLVALLEEGTGVTVSMAPVVVAAELVAIDQQGRLREFGFIPYPFNNYLDQPLDNFYLVALEAYGWHVDYQRDSRLAAEEAAGEVTVVPLLEGEWVEGGRAYAEVELPDAETMAGFDTLEVDLSLGCKDRRHGNCPAWDYIVDLWLCTGEDPESCTIEMARWITPYWSEGHWVTDITPLLGFLSEGGRRKFAFRTQQRYRVDLSLRFSNRGRGYRPREAIDLGLNGGPFWKDYNKLFQPIEFEVPEWADGVEVASVITGHGFGRDTENCAEFCNHTHHFSVNGRPEHVKAHPEAGTLLGCAEKVPLGVVPNQGGTWIYGRGGWCPGLDVPPWVIDISDEVYRDRTNVLTYRGLFNGQDYVAVPVDPNQQPNANIRMRAFLVFLERTPTSIYLPVLPHGP